MKSALGLHSSGMGGGLLTHLCHLYLNTGESMTSSQFSGSEKTLCSQGGVTFPLTAAPNLSEEIKPRRVYLFLRCNFSEVGSITTVESDILNCFNSVSMFKLISLFHLNRNSHLITLAAKLQIIFESNTT